MKKIIKYIIYIFVEAVFLELEKRFEVLSVEAPEASKATKKKKKTTKEQNDELVDKETGEIITKEVAKQRLQALKNK